MTTGAQRTILVVEDEPDVRRYVTAQLQSLGYRVVEVEDGCAGRAVLDTNDPIDLLLTDVVLPHGISGLSLARQAQAIRPHLKVLLISGFSAHAFAAEGGSDLPLLRKPFKRHDLADAVQRALDAPQPQAATPIELGRGRILVVDDLDQNRQFVISLLIRAGYEVDGAANGLEAVSAVQAKAYDVILMDAQMPGLDGVEATRRIRDLDGPTGEVLIIGLSAGNLPEQIRAMESAGMDDYLAKPFRRTDLLDKLAAWGIGRSAGQSAASPDVETEITVADAAPSETEAPAGFCDLVDLIGRDAALLGVTRLKQQIEETFTASCSEPRQLGRQAHALVAQAGLLGFKTLADLCSRLEKACLGHGDLALAYAEAERAARHAVEQMKRFTAS